MKFDEDDASGRVPGRIHQLAEIAVFGDQDAALGERTLHYPFVGGAFRHLSNRNQVVAGCAQYPDHRPRAALVCQQLHASGFSAIDGVREQHNFFVRDARGAVSNRSSKVFGSEVWIVL